MKFLLLFLPLTCFADCTERSMGNGFEGTITLGCEICTETYQNEVLRKVSATRIVDGELQTVHACYFIAYLYFLQHAILIKSER
mgnify:CR=1 FL=1